MRGLGEVGDGVFEIAAGYRCGAAPAEPLRIGGLARHIPGGTRGVAGGGGYRRRGARCARVSILRWRGSGRGGRGDGVGQFGGRPGQDRLEVEDRATVVGEVDLTLPVRHIDMM